MGRLIDADKLKAYLQEKYVMYDHTLEDIDAQSTVDAVEVIRCKDCKWYKESKYPELRPMRFCYRLRDNNGDHVGYNWDENDFCSRGEMEEDGKTN